MLHNELIPVTGCLIKHAHNSKARFGTVINAIVH